MKLIQAGHESFSAWVNQSFTCPKTGNKYQIDMEDITAAIKKNNNNVLSGVLRCPDCGAKVSFESDQREGAYLLHK